MFSSGFLVLPQDVEEVVHLGELAADHGPALPLVIIFVLGARPAVTCGLHSQSHRVLDTFRQELSR